MANGFVFWCNRTRFKVVVYKVEQRSVITAIGTAVPPVINHVIYKVEITIHSYRRAAADIARPQVTHERAVMSADGAAKSVIIGIEAFRKNTVRHGDVHGRQLLRFRSI